MFLLNSSDYQIKPVGRKGRGVFAKKEIAAGTVIGDYLGYILSNEEVARREKIAQGYYSFEYVNHDTSIWPLDLKAADVHLINHSCSPNCSTIDLDGHNVFYALRHIFPGEELNIDYEFDPEYNSGPAPCFCDSPFCRGTMYARADKNQVAVKKSKAKVRLALHQKQGAKHKFPVARVGEILPPLAKYPTKIGDFTMANGRQTDIFASLSAKPLVGREGSLPTMAELRRRLRRNGRQLYFPKLKLTILGLADGHLLAKR